MRITPSTSANFNPFTRVEHAIEIEKKDLHDGCSLELHNHHYHRCVCAQSSLYDSTMHEVTSSPSPLPTLYKVLRDGHSCHGGTYKWSLPTVDGPGDWHEVKGALKQCQNGFHLTTRPNTRWNECNQLYVVEVDVAAGLLAPEKEEREDGGEDTTTDQLDEHESDEWISRRVRLVRRVLGEELVALVRSVKPLEQLPEKLYAILEDAIDQHTKFTWPVPKKGQPGDWAEWKRDGVCAEILTSSDGLRITPDPSYRYNKACEVWEVEVEGTVWKMDSDTELRASKARLLRRLSEAEMDKLGIGVDRNYRRRSSWNYSRYDSIRKRDPKGASPGERFVRLMAEYGDVSTARDVSEDERRFVREALALAIRGGLEFKGTNVFNDVGNPDGYYGTAIEAGNISACEAIEAALGRRPWVWCEKRLGDAKVFQWAGYTVRITSFMDEKDQIVACAYQDRVKVRYEGTAYAEEYITNLVAKRFVIDHAEFDNVAKLFKLRTSKAESFKKKAEWLCKEDRASSYLAERLATCMWFWTKEQHIELNKWIELRKDANRHSKKRVANEPIPEFVKQAATDVAADVKEYDSIRDMARSRVGDEPDRDNYKHDYNYECARKVWRTKLDTACAALLSTRPTAIGRFERALHAWAATNFSGDPNDYLDMEKRSKRRSKSA